MLSAPHFIFLIQTQSNQAKLFNYQTSIEFAQQWACLLHAKKRIKVQFLSDAIKCWSCLVATTQHHQITSGPRLVATTPSDYLMAPSRSNNTTPSDYLRAPSRSNNTHHQITSGPCLAATTQHHQITSGPYLAPSDYLRASSRSNNTTPSNYLRAPVSQQQHNTSPSNYLRAPSRNNTTPSNYLTLKDAATECWYCLELSCQNFE
jgi:hypothetical protein